MTRLAETRAARRCIIDVIHGSGYGEVGYADPLNGSGCKMGFSERRLSIRASDAFLSFNKPNSCGCLISRPAIFPVPPRRKVSSKFM